jgi:hypothetical protein
MASQVCSCAPRTTTSSGNWNSPAFLRYCGVPRVEVKFDIDATVFYKVRLFSSRWYLNYVDLVTVLKEFVIDKNLVYIQYICFSHDIRCPWHGANQIAEQVTARKNSSDLESDADDIEIV